MGLAIFGLLVSCFLFYSAASGASQRDKLKLEQKEIKKSLFKELELQEFHIDVEYYFAKMLSGIFVGIAIDENRQLVSVSSSKDAHEIIPFSEIIGCDIREEDSIVGGVGRAIVGGVIAGGAGAVVGATTAKNKKINSFEIIIYRDNIKHPQIILTTINFSVKMSSINYIDSVKFANNVNASIKAIVSQNSSSTNQNNVKNQPTIKVD